MRVNFIHAKESNVRQISLPDLIAAALMQKMRQEEILSDEHQAKNSQIITRSGDVESTT